MAANIETFKAPELTQYKISVLLIDDQQIVGDAVKRMLAGEDDIVFHFCQDPTKAVGVAAEIGPTVILQDLVMPDIDGLTLVKFIRAHPKLKDTPLIVLSSKEEAITKADAFALGANDYIVKLPDRIELIARIRYHSKGYINLLQRNEAYSALLQSQQTLANEIARAADYVLSLIPKPVKEGKIQTDWRLIPSIELGGDSFGFHDVDDEHFAMYLLDVCNHGVGPALLSVSVLNVLRSQSLNADFRNPSDVLSALNDAFQMSNQNDLYFTIWYGVYNKTTGVINYSSGGHPPALLFNTDSSIDELIAPNFIVGGLPGFEYSSKSHTIVAPAELYIFSDGVYEVQCPDGSMWTLDDLKKYLLENSKPDDSEIDALYNYLKNMSGQSELDDDFSMLKITFK